MGNARCFSAFPCLPIKRKISRTMATLGGLGEPKKATRPLDLTDKHIFVHVISKSSIRLSKYSFKEEKYFCFDSLLSNRLASLTIFFFWILQYLLFTQLPKNNCALGTGSRTLKRHSHLEWSLDLSRTTVCWFSRVISERKDTNLHLHMQISGYILGTVRKISSVVFSIWYPSTRSCCNGAFSGKNTAAVWDKNTPHGSKPCLLCLGLSNLTTFL